MLRAAVFAIAAFACACACAQDYSGTFSMTSPHGGPVTLTLKQDAQQQVTGTLAGNGATFKVDAKVMPDGLMGTISGDAGELYLMAKLDGPHLMVILAEAGTNGHPNLQVARRLVFTRAGAAKSSAGEAPAAGIDGQLTQLLTRNAWCGFTSNQRTGTSTRERVVFHGNGTVMQSSGAETYNSGPAGSVAGQSGNANQGRWKVANGALHLSQDGMNWTPQPLQVTQSSSGYPILKSGGKEYMQCN